MRKALLAGVALGIMTLASPALAQNEKQGGSMIVTYQNDVSTLDPAIGYDWQNWSIIKSIYDGLMDYEPGTATLANDLAESHTISPDGLIYTFKLHQGVKFHNGREMTADDVKYSLDRVTNPETQSPGAGFFASIAGYEEAAGGSGSLSGVKVVDPYTVEITLSRPDATFLHVMAINFAFVVPKEAVDQFGADFGRNPVGTGAFKMQEWALGQRIVLARNADHWKAGVPKLDQITFEIGVDPSVALLRLQNGEVDILGDGIPPAQFLAVKDSPEWGPLIVEGGQLHTGYVTMNVNTPPFDNVDVRKAVNMAINKDRIVRIINNRALPANQPLPPSMPGYATDYAGYAYDPEGAKALLAAAGHGNGITTELYVYNTDPNPRIAQAIQQDLAAVGITAELRSLAQANVIEAGGNGSAPMIWSGGMAWIADFPDPSNFYGPILGCGGAGEGGWNWSKYCNEELDAKGVAADSIVDPAKAAEREAMWREVYLGVMEDAPWAPIFNEQRFTMRAARLGGPDSYFVDPVHIPVAYDYVFDKDVQ